jgi:SCP1.201-like deaminase
MPEDSPEQAPVDDPSISSDTPGADPGADYMSGAVPGVNYTPGADPGADYMSGAVPGVNYTPGADPGADYMSGAVPGVNYTQGPASSGSVTTPAPSAIPPNQESGSSGYLGDMISIPVVPSEPQSNVNAASTGHQEDNSFPLSSAKPVAPLSVDPFTGRQPANPFTDRQPMDPFTTDQKPDPRLSSQSVDMPRLGNAVDSSVPRTPTLADYAGQVSAFARPVSAFAFTRMAPPGLTTAADLLQSTAKALPQSAARAPLGLVPEAAGVGLLTWGAVTTFVAGTFVAFGAFYIKSAFAPDKLAAERVGRIATAHNLLAEGIISEEQANDYILTGYLIIPRQPSPKSQDLLAELEEARDFYPGHQGEVGSLLAPGRQPMRIKSGVEGGPWGGAQRGGVPRGRGYAFTSGGPGQGNIATHVEGHAAAIMSQQNIKTATLVMGAEQCSICANNLPAALPAGSQLKVINVDPAGNVISEHIYRSSHAF